MPEFDGTEQLTPLKDLLNQVVTAANARIQAGTGIRSIAAAGTTYTATVNFPVAYDAPPIVLVSSVTNAPHLKFATPTTITATGITISCRNEATTSQVVYTWIAIGPAPA